MKKLSRRGTEIEMRQARLWTLAGTTGFGFPRPFLPRSASTQKHNLELSRAHKPGLRWHLKQIALRLYDTYLTKLLTPCRLHPASHCGRRCS